MCSFQRSFLLPFVCVLSAFLLPGEPSYAAPNARISAMTKEVQASNDSPGLDSFADYLSAIFTGEGSERGYDDEGEPMDDLLNARQVIFNELSSSLGAQNVSWQRFNGNGYPGANIVGVIRGEGRNKASRYLINAHYDSQENPGADDNGSGVAGLLEAARVLGKYRFDATIVFVALDQEEERDNGWGMGSRYYAKKAKRASTKLKAAVSLDSMGFNDEQSDWMAISRCDATKGSASARLSKEFGRAIKDYSGLHPDYFEEEDSSDPYLFFRYGFPAILVSQELDDEGELSNPFNHEASDFFLTLAGVPQQYRRTPYIDVEYAADIVRGAVGWAASKARLLGSR